MYSLLWLCNKKTHFINSWAISGIMYVLPELMIPVIASLGSQTQMGGRLSSQESMVRTQGCVPGGVTGVGWGCLGCLSYLSNIQKYAKFRNILIFVQVYVYIKQEIISLNRRMCWYARLVNLWKKKGCFLSMGIMVLCFQWGLPLLFCQVIWKQYGSGKGK